MSQLGLQLIIEIEKATARDSSAWMARELLGPGFISTSASMKHVDVPATD